MKEAANKAAIRRLQVYAEKVPCKPACSACCARQIRITVAEALVIQDHLEKAGTWPDVERRARAQLKMARDSSPLSWFKMNIMCPVLDPTSKLCTAYEQRPAQCSTHFVTSNPSLCDPWSTTPGDFELVDFKDLKENFQKSLEKTIDGYGILALHYPMPIALIFASRIKIQSGIGPNEIMSLIFNELQ